MRTTKNYPEFSTQLTLNKTLFFSTDKKEKSMKDSLEAFLDLVSIWSGKNKEEFEHFKPLMSEFSFKTVLFI